MVPDPGAAAAAGHPMPAGRAVPFAVRTAAPLRSTMRHIAVLALTPLLLAPAACGNDDGPGGPIAAFCDQAEALGDFGASIAPGDPGALADGVDRIEALADDAPEEISDELRALTVAISSFAANLARADPADPQAQLDAVRSLFDDVNGQALDEALGAVQDFSQRECGIDPETIDPSFAALEEQIGATSESPGDTAGDAAEEIPGELPDPGPPPSTEDPQMEPLIDACEGGDMAACDDLVTSSEIGSDAEKYGATCGARVDDAAGATCVALFP